MTDTASDRLRWLDPKSGAYRWSIMVAVGLMLFGGYFALYSVSSISKLLDEEGYTTAQVGLMDSVFSWPNALGTVLLTGILIDKFGTRATSLVFSVLVVAGAIVTATAPDFTTLLIGRAILGIGAETLGICQGAILCKWFRGKDLALSLALALVFLRLGSTASLNVGTPIAKQYGGSSATFGFAAIVCVVSLAAAVFYIVLERGAEGKVELEAEDVSSSAEDEGETSKFDARFWYLVVITTACYCAILPFQTLAQAFFYDKWGIATETGARIVSTLPFLSMLLAPAIGWAIDKVGRRTTLIMWSTILLIAAHLAMGLSSLQPVWPVITLALAYAIIGAVVWPAVTLVVDERIIGTAFGLVFTIQNLGLAVFPYANGALRGATDSYLASELMFASLGFIALLSAILLRRADRRQGDVLEKTTDAAPDDETESAVG